MSRHDDFARLVDEVYAAAVGAECWSIFWEDLRTTLHATATAAMSRQLSTFDSRVWGAGADAEAVALYEARYAALDPWYRAAMRDGLQVQATPYVGEQVVGIASLQRTEFYADYARRFDVVRPLTIASQRPDDVFALTVVRAESMDAWSDADVTLVLAIEAHVRRAIEIQTRLGASEHAAHLAHEVLERLGVGIVAARPDGRTAFANARARAIAGANDGFMLGVGGPQATDPVARAALRLMMSTCRRTDAVPQSGLLLLPRPSGRQPYQVRVTPCSRSWSPADDVSALLVITAPDDVAVDGAFVLKRFPQLTESEADVAARLTSGESLPLIAQRRHASVHTVRNQVKSLLAKVGVRRQIDLVRALTAMACSGPVT